MKDQSPSARELRARDILQVNLLRPDVMDILARALDPATDRYARNGLTQQAASILAAALAGRATAG